MAQEDIPVVNPGAVALARGGNLPLGGRDLGNGIAAAYQEIVDSSGNPLGTSGNPLYTESAGGGSSSVTINDPTTPSQKAQVDSNGALLVKIAEATVPAVQLYDNLSGNSPGVRQPTAGFSGNWEGLVSTSYDLGYNGVTYDPIRVAPVGTDTASGQVGAQVVQGSSHGVPIPITTDGTGATGVSQDAGGSGALGWLSSIVNNIRSLVARLTSGTATLANVGSSTSSVSLLASNANRKSYVIFNDSTQILYVAHAASASNTAYTYQVQPQGTLESLAPVYTGAISGIWASANGNARITEHT